MAIPTVTIEDYLQILPDYKFPKRFIDSAMAAYQIESGSLAFPNPEPKEWERKRDLAEAMMWFYASGLFSGGGSRKQIGNRAYTDMSKQLSKDDRDAFRSRANELRIKWGEPIFTEPDIVDYTDLWR